jgi:23S rRNA (guanosine2251-2'-O)-methyltransferase
MYIYGKNPVQAAIEESYVNKVIVQRGIKNLDSIFELCKKYSVSIDLQDKSRLDSIVSAPHQGVIAKIKKFKYESKDSLLNYKRILILDRVQDPHNFGALIRSAYAFKYDCIVIQEKNSVQVTPAVAKVSTGLVFKLPIVMVSNVKYAIDKLLDNFYEVFVADMNGKTLWDTDFKVNHCVILGNEGSGVRDIIKKRATQVLSIPMNQGIDSLNVSVSGAIIMYESYKQICQG